MRVINKDVIEVLRSSGKVEKPQIDASKESRTEVDLTEVLREYDEALEIAARRDLEAKIASLQMEPARNNDERG